MRTKLYTLAILIGFQSCKTVQVSNGSYILNSFAGNNVNATSYVGQSAVNSKRSSSPAKDGLASVIVDRSDMGTRIREIDGLEVESFEAAKATSERKDYSRKFINIDAKFADELPIGARVRVEAIKSIHFKIDSMKQFITLGGRFNYDNMKICATGLNRFNGSFRIPKDRGYNYIDRILKVDGVLEIELKREYTGQVDIVFGKTLDALKADGALLGDNKVSFQFKDVWA